MATIYARSIHILDSLLPQIKSPCSAYTFDSALPCHNSIYRSFIPNLNDTSLDAFICFDQLPSTQSYLLNIKTDYRILVGANTQTSGVGRKGNEWISPLGSLCFSHNFTVPRNKLMLSQYMCAYSAYQSLNSIAGIVLKWPNDLYHSNAKVCGVLCNLAKVKDNIAYVVAGIGLNLMNSYKGVSIHSLNPQLDSSSIISKYLHSINECIRDDSFSDKYSDLMDK